MQPEGEDPTVLSSEAPSLRFETLGLEDGLAQNTVMDVLQDSLGFIWVATQGGLHRYDGYEFKLYKSEPFDSTSLSKNFVRSITEAKNGDLWVATEGGGLNRLNRSTGTFKHYMYDPDDSTSLSSNNTLAVYTSSNGDLWVATADGGVNRMHRGEDGFTHYKADKSKSNSITSNYINNFFEDNEGFIWVATVNGANRLNPETDEIVQYLYDSDGSSGDQNNPNLINGLYQFPDSQDIIWLATGNGLVRLNYRNNTHERFLVEKNSARNALTEITPDPSIPGILWISGSVGLARFDTRTKEFTTYENDPRLPNSLPENSSESIMTDRTGKIWLGHIVEGLSSFNPKSANFTHLRHDPDNPHSLSEGVVWGMYRDDSETLWAGIGFDNPKLNRINLHTGIIETFIPDSDNPSSLLPGSILSITEDHSGTIWVGTQYGLNSLNQNNGNINRFQIEPFDENINWNFVTAIQPSKADGGLWVGSLNGLSFFDAETEEFSKAEFSFLESETVVVSHLYQDKEGVLWIGSYTGLIKIPPNKEPILAASYNPNDTTSINSNAITSIHERQEEPGILWLATNGGGLNRYDKNTETVTHYTTEDGLSNNSLYGILEDNKGTLWMSTNHGISNFDPDTETFRNYGLEDGLMALEYSQNSYEKDPNGILYFGSNNGITAFNPENLRTNDIPPQVLLSEIRLFNEPVTPGPDSPLSEPIEEAEEITIEYDQNEITFEYVALHYDNPSKNQYAYQLEGFEEDWVQAGTKRTASYTNLEPGSYTFKVKAANSDNVWNEKGASIALTVLPPWYQTWWAYGLFALLLGGFIFGVDRLQRRRLTKKEREKAALREAELRAEAENKRRADTEQLSQIGRAITSSLSVDKIIDTVYKNVNDLMDATIFGVGIYNKEEDQLEFPATKEKGQRLPAYVNSLNEENRLAVQCFKNQEKILIGDYQNEYSNYLKRHKKPVQGEDPTSIIYLPLIHQDKTVGVITTQSFEKDAYTPYHVNLLRNLATYAAIALDNASAYRQLNTTLKDLKDAQGQLVQQEKLASLGQLTAGIAHEIKNPLNFVNNFSDLSIELIEEARDEVKSVKAYGDTPQQNEGFDEIEYLLKDVEANLRKIHEHGSRADSIVKSMLQHSRGGDGKMEPTNLNALIKEYVNLSFHGMRASKNPINVDIEQDLDEEIGEIDLITEDFSRVILNLCNNAFDAMRDKLSANSNQNYEPKLIVRTHQKNQHITIQIVDNGPGIPEEAMDKILQPFFTTKKGTEGTGLGLSITHDIINAHGGQIDIESEPGSTCFTITLSK